MLVNYIQNSTLSVTKETYFEMCELMGNEPIEEEIPIEYDDFPIEVQQAFAVYRMLRDEWDTMNGVYLGKTLIGKEMGDEIVVKAPKGDMLYEVEDFTYKEIAIEELKSNMIPFKIRRFVKDHYEIWKIEELNKKHLEPLFY